MKTCPWCAAVTHADGTFSHVSTCRVLTHPYHLSCLMNRKPCPTCPDGDLEVAGDFVGPSDADEIASLRQQLAEAQGACAVTLAVAKELRDDLVGIMRSEFQTKNAPEPEERFVSIKKMRVIEKHGESESVRAHLARVEKMRAALKQAVFLIQNSDHTHPTVSQKARVVDACLSALDADKEGT